MAILLAELYTALYGRTGLQSTPVSSTSVLCMTIPWSSDTKKCVFSFKSYLHFTVLLLLLLRKNKSGYFPARLLQVGPAKL